MNAKTSFIYILGWKEYFVNFIDRFLKVKSSHLYIDWECVCFGCKQEIDQESQSLLYPCPCGMAAGHQHGPAYLGSGPSKVCPSQKSTGIMFDNTQWNFK